MTKSRQIWLLFTQKDILTSLQCKGWKCQRWKYLEDENAEDEIHWYCDDNIWNLLASYRKLVVKLGFTWSRRHKTTDFRVIIHSEKKVVTATAGYSLHTAILECNWHQKNEIGGWFIHTGHKTQTLQIENLLNVAYENQLIIDHLDMYIFLAPGRLKIHRGSYKLEINVPRLAAESVCVRWSCAVRRFSVCELWRRAERRLRLICQI